MTRATMGGIATALLLSGCGLGGTDRLGVSPEGPNGVRIHFIPCPGEAVTKVALLGKAESVGFEIGNDEPADDSEDDEFSAWQVADSRGSSETFFDVGTTPPGFVEEVPLTEPVPEVDQGLAVFVGFDSDGLRSAQMGFDLDELQAGSIFTTHGLVSPESYEQAAAADCEG